MLDSRYFQDQVADLEKALKRRNVSQDLISRVVELSQKRRELIQEVDGLKAKRNSTSQEIAQLKAKYWR